MSLYDKDDPQAQVYERHWGGVMDRYNREKDPLKWYWQRGLEALRQLRRSDSS
jgi:hypothetical protein